MQSTLAASRRIYPVLTSHRSAMTKRKRTPTPTPTPPSPAPRKHVIFEVPQSLWTFQAVARELARQSELMVQRVQSFGHDQSCHPQRPAPDRPLFDAQTFQNNALRFSPYSHQPSLPSQPWPQAAKSMSVSSGSSPEPTGSANPARVRADGVVSERGTRRLCAGPEDQLFGQLHDALHTGEAEGEHGPGPPSQYLADGIWITFDPRLTGHWNGTRHPEPYQPFMLSFPQINLPSYPTNLAPVLYHQPHPFPQIATQTQSDTPACYKGRFKVWSQQDQYVPPLSSRSSFQPTLQFKPVNRAYTPVIYSGTTTYPPAPPPLPPPDPPPSKPPGRFYKLRIHEMTEGIHDPPQLA